MPNHIYRQHNRVPLPERLNVNSGSLIANRPDVRFFMDETRLAVHPAGTSGGDSGLLRVRHFEEPNFTMKSYQNPYLLPRTNKAHYSKFSI